VKKEQKSRRWVRRVAGFCALLLCWMLIDLNHATLSAQEAPQNWTHYVRIGAYGLERKDAASIVRDAQNTHVFGIEVDNDIPGRYESFLDPRAKLEAIRQVSEAAHRAGNKAFVYIAGTECITANAGKSAHSVMKDHPDWLQRNIKGEPAVFTSGAAFWISPGDEDVWISPYAKEWRKTYMERVRQIAATGIDGIYVDIPYWMTHFDGWEDTWASFDDSTVAAFKAQTGLDAKKDLKLGDFGDANFRKWIDFRIATLTEFVGEIRETARRVNPNIMLIPEIYPGLEEEATRVGSDVYQMYGVVDAIAHEYEFGGGEHLAATRTQLDWFLYQAGMLTFRAFAEGKATWILNYSWDGQKGVAAADAMKNLAASQVMAGANFWDAAGHVMSGSNDPATRTEIFQWIEKHEKVLYRPRTHMQPVGVYFSPKSRDYAASEFLPSYRGMLVLLLQRHREFAVVTPRTLKYFRGRILALPNVTVLDEEEKQELAAFVKNGGKLVVTGKNATGMRGEPQVLEFSNCPAKAYLEGLEKNFADGASRVPLALLDALDVHADVRIAASPYVAANIALVDGKTTIFFANFAGLLPDKVAVPVAAQDVEVSVPAGKGDTATFLPFLGEEKTVKGRLSEGRMIFVLPAIERGAVVQVVAAH
jgi:hypothetical protein